MARKQRRQDTVPVEDVKIKDFLDMIAPGVMKFNADNFISGNTFRCVWALREYPASTDQAAILRLLGEKDGVTLRIYTRPVTPNEEHKILANAANKNRMNRANTNDLQTSVTAESNLQDVTNLIAHMHRSREPLLHCAVFIELSANDEDRLKLLQTEVLAELVRSKLNVDRLMLRQQEGHQCIMPSGYNTFKTQFERVLPASSVANLFPFSYSGKTDPHGYYIGRDKYGSNILVDFHKREEDKTNSSILCLGNSGQGKSHLYKLILTNLLESGMSACCIDPEHEYRELAENLGGSFIDLMTGEYMINVLEPKSWDDNPLERETGDELDEGYVPEAFLQSSRLDQHISFFKDWLRSCKDFSDRHIDTIEIMVSKLYASWGFDQHTDYSNLEPTDYPILSDLYDLIDAEYQSFDESKRQIYTKQLLQEVLLGLHSMCKGSESRYFNGHTNIKSHRFIVFGVKKLLQASKSLVNGMLFNTFSYMANALLSQGNTAACIDELYLFLTNMTAIEYIRNLMKRARKKESLLMLASQNLEDFDIDGIREYTKPLFSIPTHAFLFNAGNIDSRFYIDALQLEESEFNLIKYPQRGVCLYKCGNERYNLMVHAPEHKARLFGKAGGR